MKDIGARTMLELLDRRLEDLEKRISNIRQATIKYCPKCKHETVQREKTSDFNSCTTSTVAFSNFIERAEYSICLNCGSRIKCKTETICEIDK